MYFQEMSVIGLLSVIRRGVAARMGQVANAQVMQRGLVELISFL